jgi:hypothetical protein
VLDEKFSTSTSLSPLPAINVSVSSRKPPPAGSALETCDAAAVADESGVDLGGLSWFRVRRCHKRERGDKTTAGTSPEQSRGQCRRRNPERPRSRGRCLTSLGANRQSLLSPKNLAACRTQSSFGRKKGERGGCGFRLSLSKKDRVQRRTRWCSGYDERWRSATPFGLFDDSRPVSAPQYAPPGRHPLPFQANRAALAPGCVASKTSR